MATRWRHTLTGEMDVLLRAFLNSYSQVFFSDNRLFAFLLIPVTFFDLNAGLSGLISVITTILLSYLLGLDKHKLAKGLYGFNSLLVGLGLGVYFEPSVSFFFILLLATAFTLFISVSLEGVIGKYALPYLSLPFIFSIWVVAIAARQFEALGISERGIYTLNDLYTLGGQRLIQLYDWFNGLHIPGAIRTYLLSLGAIFFQFNVLAGMIIAAGLLYYSRIAFSLSLLGFFAAYLFYLLIGARLSDLNYSFIGFNYILTSIAIGGFFIIPSRSSYLWTLLLIPLVAVLTISLDAIFMNFGLLIYALPFNILVILFLYTLKFRTRHKGLLQEVYIQQNSPEKNLYAYRNSIYRFGGTIQIPMKLPFWGTWTVAQGHDGEYTHQGEWKHAWDFIITSPEGKQFRNQGELLDDYYCYSKDVLAPADGIVEEITDGIDENKVGDVNIINNWGNTVIVRHADFLYSKMSHLKRDSIRVKKGERVQAGDVIAKVGNSGRSPYPHLHFQFQATPYVGSKTFCFPFAHYIEQEDGAYRFRSYSVPSKDNRLSNIQVNDLLKNVFLLVPGKTLTFSLLHGGSKKEVVWEVCTDVYNQPYILCPASGDMAYFRQDGQMLMFTHYQGNRNSLLHYFYLAAFKIPMGYYQDMELTDQYPLNHLLSGVALSLHDFFAPFVSFLKATYRVRFVRTDNPQFPTLIVVASEASTWLAGKLLHTYHFSMEITPEGIGKFVIRTKNTEITAKCIG